jgi:hypothetical protein
MNDQQREQRDPTFHFKSIIHGRGVLSGSESCSQRRQDRFGIREVDLRDYSSHSTNGEVVVPTVSTYHWHWNKGSKYAQEYAYPCYLAGTLAVCFGVSLCSRAIDLATEFEIIPFGKRRIGPIFHIQLPCTIGDQDFPAALIMNNNSNHGIRISRLRRVKREVRQVEPLL